ncbi:MAG: hypothetical protein HY985_16875 [Magnetospirillum sp.]|nr:hypothetical protein [Magnetospirillum sp.]
MKMRSAFGLVSAAAALAVGLGTAKPAAAFDSVHWSWYAQVSEWAQIDLHHWTNFVDPGWTQVERFQVNAGNIYAVTDQSYSAAYVPSGSNTYVPIYINIDQYNVNAALQKTDDQYASNVDVDKKDHGWGWGYDKDHGKDGDQTIGQLQANLAFQAINAPITINIDMKAMEMKAADALTDLGRIEGAATAMANFASLQADVGANFHDTQIAFGDFKKLDAYDTRGLLTYDLATTLIDYALPTGNRGTDALTAAAIEAQFGLVKKGTVTALALADDVTNLAITEDATAFGNIHTVSNEPTYNAERLYKNIVYSPSTVMGDLTQFNFNDVTAVASAKNQKLYGFKNLGAIDGTVSKLTATAMGNMSSVVNKVKLP